MKNMKSLSMRLSRFRGFFSDKKAIIYCSDIITLELWLI